MQVNVAVADPPPLTDQERAQSVAASREIATVRAQVADGRPARSPHRRLSEARWSTFIQHVRAIGNARHAAALADGDRAWTTLATYMNAMRADPLRQREFDGAVAYFEARISRELIRRGIEGTDRAKWHNGEIVGYEKEFDGKIALALGSHFVKLIERRQDSTLTVQHAGDADDTVFRLTWDSVQRMPEQIRRDFLVPLLEWIRADKAKMVGFSDASDDAEVIEHDDGELPPLSEEDAAELESIR